MSKVKYSNTNIKQKRAKQQSKQTKNKSKKNTTYRDIISIVMHVTTLQGENSVFYPLFSPETFTAELHLGLKAQICNQIAFKKCGGRTQKYVFLTNHGKSPKSVLVEKTRWTVCRPLVKFLLKNSQIPPRGSGFFYFKILVQR